jgi:hypothetical protein
LRVYCSVNLIASDYQKHFDLADAAASAGVRSRQARQQVDGADADFLGQFGLPMTFRTVREVCIVVN